MADFVMASAGLGLQAELAADGDRLSTHVQGPLAIPARAPRWALVADRDLSQALRDVGHPPEKVVPIPKWTFSRFVHLGGV